MGDLLEYPSNNYKRWAILQRMAELTKWIRLGYWTQERQDELDNLKKDLDDIPKV